MEDREKERKAGLVREKWTKNKSKICLAFWYLNVKTQFHISCDAPPPFFSDFLSAHHLSSFLSLGVAVHPSVCFLTNAISM